MKIGLLSEQNENPPRPELIHSVKILSIRRTTGFVAVY